MAKFKLNGETTKVDADDSTPLLWVLRDELKLTGTKYSCGKGICGACTVHLGGQAIRACVTPLAAVDGQELTTIEGFTAEEYDDKQLAKELVAAWEKHNVPQCGFCQPGQIMSAAALLSSNKKPSEADIEQGMNSNLCRCGTYPRIKNAILDAAKELNHE